MKFYDLHVQSNFSEGENSIEELAKFAKNLGYSGIAVCDYFESMEKLRKLKEIIKSMDIDIEVFPGVEIRTKSVEELKEIIKKVREEVLIVVVSGGNYLINRAACEDSRVDILAHPELGRNDSGLDHICARAAAENNVAIEINFREMLYSFRKPRSHIFAHISRNIKLCTKFNTPLVICSGARSIWDMRGARELVSVANTLGLDLSKAFAAVTSTPQQIIEDNKKKLEGKKITEGVEIVEDNG